MQAFKRIIKKYLVYLFGLGPQRGVRPPGGLVYLGSKFHGYHVPERLLGAGTVCYCVGAGEDISFDTELVVRYGAQVFIFDPAPEGIRHFRKLQEAVREGRPLMIEDRQSPFTYRITAGQLDTIRYIQTGLWDRETTIRFNKPANPNYASHSIVLFGDTGEFIDAPVDRLTAQMKKCGHETVDLLKLEIEGAEYKVLDTVLEDRADVRMIAVEFDEVFHVGGLAPLFRIRKYAKKLERAGYVLAHSSPTYKRLFIRKDVFETLRRAETD